jgi:hypothetical protein
MSVTGSIPTRIFHRDLYARTASEVQNAVQLLVAKELNFDNITPEQRSWFLGARCALSWVLGLPKGGRKMEQLIGGVDLRAAISLQPGTDFINEARSYTGFNFGG